MIDRNQMAPAGSFRRPLAEKAFDCFRNDAVYVSVGVIISIAGVELEPSNLLCSCGNKFI